MRTVPQDYCGTLNTFGWFRQGNYYTQNYTYQTFIDLTVAAERLYAAPFYTCNDIIIDQIGFRVRTLASGKYGRVGVYANALGRSLPSKLILDGGTKDVGSTGFKSTDTWLFLKGGRLYWFAFLSDGTPAVAAGEALPILGCHGLHESGGAQSIFYVYSNSVSYGALPATFPAITNLGSARTIGKDAPYVYFKTTAGRKP